MRKKMLLNGLELSINIDPKTAGKVSWKTQCSREVEALMMENLAVDMMDISF